MSIQPYSFPELFRQYMERALVMQGLSRCRTVVLIYKDTPKVKIKEPGSIVFPALERIVSAPQILIYHDIHLIIEINNDSP